MNRTTLLSFLFLFLVPVALFAEGMRPIVLDDDFTFEFAAHYADCLYDGQGAYGIREVSSPELSDSFTAMDPTGRVDGKNRIVWMRFNLDNRSGAVKTWYLEYAYLKNGVVLDVYRPAAGGTFDVVRAYPGIPPSDLDLAFRHYVFCLELAPGETKTVYVRAEMTTDLYLVLKIWHPEVFLNTIRYEQLFIGLFIGVMIVMAIYNFFLFLSFRDISYAWYILFLLSLLVLQLNNHNLFSEWFPSLARFEAVIVTVFKLFSFTGFLLFSRSFLNLKLHFPSTDRLLRAIILAVIALGAISLWFEGFGTVSNASMGASGLLVMALAVRLLVKGNRTAVYFLTATAALIVFGLLVMLPEELFYFKALDFLVPFYIDIGSLLMIVLFSFGLAFRINMLRREKEQADRIRELDGVKSRFFANITHEFRTPLTLIMGPLEDLISEADEPERKKKLEMMLRNSDRLLRLVNQLLDLSKLESGKAEVHAGERDLVSLVKSITANFEYICNRRQVRLSFEAEPGELPVYFDYEMMEKICLNLLINAVKFTPADGNLSVSCTKAERGTEKKLFPEGFAEISVSNTGPALEPEQLERLFDYFYQADKPEAQVQQGSGIGLALVRELVALHHGTITVTNRTDTDDGRNRTVFAVRIPLGKRHFRETDLVPERPAVREFPSPAHLRDLYGGIRSARETDPVLLTSEQEEGKKNTVLVIDDSEEVRAYLKDGLKDDYDVLEAFDGDEGLRKAREYVPDLIVCDLMMPGADGYAVTRTLKKDIGTSHIPIVLLTAKASEESMIGGLESGADDYVTKPFTMKILKIRIMNLIRLRRDLQEKLQKRLLLQPSELTFASIDEKFLSDLHGAIENNLSDPDFDIDRLSGALFMSRATLNRKVRALTGNSTNQYVQSYRLKRAAQMLQANTGNVTEICYAVGFSNSAYFTKCFKDAFHQLPSQFQTVRSS